MQRPSALWVAGGLASGPLCFAVPVFEIVPLEAVSETSSNASIGDVNGDGKPASSWSKAGIGSSPPKSSWEMGRAISFPALPCRATRLKAIPAHSPI